MEALVSDDVPSPSARSRSHSRSSFWSIEITRCEMCLSSLYSICVIIFECLGKSSLVFLSHLIKYIFMRCRERCLHIRTYSSLLKLYDIIYFQNCTGAYVVKPFFNFWESLLYPLTGVDSYIIYRSLLFFIGLNIQPIANINARITVSGETWYVLYCPYVSCRFSTIYILCLLIF